MLRSMVPRYRKEDMASLFAERERDGLSILELSQRTGISRKTLYRWDRKLSRGPAKDEQGFAEAAVVDNAAEPRGYALSIRIGAATIELQGTSVDRSALDTVVAVLVERC